MDHVLDEPEHLNQINYAGLGVRFLAFLIDAALIFFALIFISILVQGLNYRAVIALLLFGTIAYFPVMESSQRQGTIGKMILRLRVGEKNGKPISLEKAMLRHICKVFSGLILCVGFLMVAGDSRKQGLHDILSKTYVVHD